jgi:hypothetical protein
MFLVFGYYVDRNPLKRLLGLGESSEKDPELGVSGKISDPFELPIDDDVKKGDVILKGELDSDIDDDDETARKDAEVSKPRKSSVLRRNSEYCKSKSCVRAPLQVGSPFIYVSRFMYVR